MNPPGGPAVGARAGERRMALSLADKRAAIFRSNRLTLPAKAAISAQVLARCLVETSAPGTIMSSSDAARAARLTRSSGLMCPRHIVVTPRLMNCIRVGNRAGAQVGSEPRAGRACLELLDMGEGDAPQPQTEVFARKAIDVRSASRRKNDGEARDHRFCIGATPDTGHDPIFGDPATD